MSNYATKSDLKSATGINTSKFAEKGDLANVELAVDDLNIEKLKTFLVDISKLNNKVKTDEFKKTI